jgi:DNA-binding LytR/AlgR family response regulator
MHDLTVIVCLAFDRKASVEALREFKACIFQCEFVETAMEVSGTYDLIVQARLSSFEQYTSEIERISAELQRFATRVDANFVGRKVDRRHSNGKALWLPVPDGRKRVSANLVDKIVAQGDYMEVHVGDWSCLVHDTIKHLWEDLDPDQFIQLHRSVVVRCDFIERLIHQDHRWIAKLRDGSQQRVAKSHVPDVLRLMESDSPTNGGDLPTIEQHNENQQTVAEIPLRLAD